MPNDSNDLATPVSLTGLTNSSYVKIEYSHLSGTPNDKTFHKSFEDAMSLCKDIFLSDQYMEDIRNMQLNKKMIILVNIQCKRRFRKISRYIN